MDTAIDPLPSIAELETLSPSELQTLYQRLLQVKAPPRFSPDFLRGNIAWQLQAFQQGQDPQALRGRLLAKAQQRTISPKTSYKAGTRLIREWQAKTYEVTILEKGYRWKNHTYRSLSEIAREITGSHWSGPRFFGLK